MKALYTAMAAAFGEIESQPGYRVNRAGNVWSETSGRFLVGSKAGRGYRFIQFPDGRREYIHRIVCRTFHGSPTEERSEVRHLDGNIDNNNAANLCWGSRLENEADKIVHGTTPKGERNPQAKLTREAVTELRNQRAKTGMSYAALARRFGVSTMTAFRAATGEAWA